MLGTTMSITVLCRHRKKAAVLIKQLKQQLLVKTSQDPDDTSLAVSVSGLATMAASYHLIPTSSHPSLCFLTSLSRQGDSRLLRKSKWHFTNILSMPQLAKQAQRWLQKTRDCPAASFGKEEIGPRDIVLNASAACLHPLRGCALQVQAQ